MARKINIIKNEKGIRTAEINNKEYKYIRYISAEDSFDFFRILGVNLSTCTVIFKRLPKFLM